MGKARIAYWWIVLSFTYTDREIDNGFRPTVAVIEKLLVSIRYRNWPKPRNINQMPFLAPEHNTEVGFDSKQNSWNIRYVVASAFVVKIDMAIWTAAHHDDHEHFVIFRRINSHQTYAQSIVPFGTVTEPTVTGLEVYRNGNPASLYRTVSMTTARIYSRFSTLSTSNAPSPTTYTRTSTSIILDKYYMERINQLEALWCNVFLRNESYQPHEKQEKQNNIHSSKIHIQHTYHTYVD